MFSNAASQPKCTQEWPPKCNRGLFLVQIKEHVCRCLLCAIPSMAMFYALGILYNVAYKYIAKFNPSCLQRQCTMQMIAYHWDDNLISHHELKEDARVQTLNFQLQFSGQILLLCFVTNKVSGVTFCIWHEVSELFWVQSVNWSQS